VNPSFFDNPAQLAVLRVDWRFLKEWDGLAEVRTLNLPDINQRATAHWPRSIVILART